MRPYTINTKMFLRALVAALLLASIACSKKESINPNATAATAASTTTTPFVSGSTATFVPDSFGVFNSYIGRTVINPTNFQVNLNVFNVATSGSTAQYGGTFSVSYVENGVQHTPDAFNSGTSVFNTQFNKWYSTGGNQKLKLFFQDNLGGMIVILQQVTINDIAVTLQGDVYYRNFDFSICQNPQPGTGLPPQCAQQSTYMCWSISAGPYDCRAFLSGGKVRPDIVDAPGFGDSQGGYNGPGWQHLGTFTGMDLSRALNGT